jgi:zinc transport system ATP-binding protein
MGRLPKKKAFLRRYDQQDKDMTYKIMKQLEIYDLRNRQIGQLSGGQMQRVLIARALALEPKILLLDEPTASVDSQSKSQIYSMLHELNKSITIVLVTHEMDVVSSYVKKLACLNTTLYYHGAPPLTNPVIEQVYGCPVDLIAHGVPHRVLHHHEEGKHD